MSVNAALNFVGSRIASVRIVNAGLADKYNFEVAAARLLDPAWGFDDGKSALERSILARRAAKFA